MRVIRIGGEGFAGERTQARSHVDRAYVRERQRGPLLVHVAANDRHDLRVHLAEEEAIRTARVARARQAFVLHDLDAELMPRTRARLDGDDI